MNVLFLTITSFTDITIRGIYTDLLRKFVEEGHKVYVVSPRERRYGIATGIVKQGEATLLGVKTLNIQKTNAIEKGIGTVSLEYKFKSAIKKYLGDISFDLILYSTPPITFPKVIQYLKKKNPNATTYLLLKDIFPQNAVDLGMMSKSGVKGILYRFFRNKEKKLYALSDFIGCMSPANVEYVLQNNPEIAEKRVEVAPNSIELVKETDVDKLAIRKKYHLPIDCPIFIYGGNLGKPQGIPYVIDCLSANATRDDCHFLIVGTGTELPKIKKWWTATHPRSVTIIDGLPKKEYDELVCACDVGLIFLDHRFSIPNYPSRLLSYLENKMPVICATDPNTDIGRIAEKNGYGYWCDSNSMESFSIILDKMIHSDINRMGLAGYKFLCSSYLTTNTYDAIIKHMYK